MKVYKAINEIQTQIAKTGIAKDRKNAQQGYQFRGIDDVYNAISPLLGQYGLCILPRMLSRESCERQTKSGHGLFYVTVEAEFDFVSSEDGSKHTVRTYGEAMDSADKATNKAMSAAYKYAIIQAFAIPTEGDNDADQITHEVSVKMLTNNEIENIKALIQETNSSVDNLLNHYKTDSLGKIPQSEYQRIVRSLEKKKTAPTLEEVAA